MAEAVSQKSFIDEEPLMKVEFDDHKLGLWKENTLRDIDNTKKAHIHLAQSLLQILEAKDTAIRTSRAFAENIASYAKVYRASKEEYKVAEDQSERDSQSSSMKQNIINLAKHLYRIENFGEMEIDALNHKVYEQFVKSFSEFPEHRKRVIDTFTESRSCILKENQARINYDKAKKGNGVPLLQKAWGRITLSESPKRAKWEESMKRVELAEAKKLTNESIEKANTAVQDIHFKFKDCIFDLLLRYINIEMMYHCKAIEELTEAYNFAKTCRKSLPDQVYAPPDALFRRSNAISMTSQTKESRQSQTSRSFKMSQLSYPLAGRNTSFGEVKLEKIGEEDDDVYSSPSLKSLRQNALDIPSVTITKSVQKSLSFNESTTTD